MAVAWVLVAALGGMGLAADGDRDTTFGGDGKVVTPFPGGAYGVAAAVQPDGKIVAVGAAAGDSFTGVFALARYDTGGTLDPGFGDMGRVTTAISDGGDEARAVAIQPDGMIVVAGTNREQFELARYDAGGELDPTFGADGVVTTNPTPDVDIVNGMVLQPNGKILVAGLATPGSPWRPRFALARYTSTGSLDPTFGEGGIVISRRGVGRAVALQADGRIVVVGFSSSGFALARYHRDGSLDARFGGDGTVDAPANGGAFSVTLQPDGKIVVGGAFDFFTFEVARFTPRGRLDPTFSRDGVVQTDVGGSEQVVIAVVVQPSGKIVAVGHAGPHETGETDLWRFVLTRYRSNGVLDPTFGRGGRVVTKFKGGAFSAGAALQPDGRIVVVGGQGDANADAFALARYLL